MEPHGATFARNTPHLDGVSAKGKAGVKPPRQPPGKPGKGVGISEGVAEKIVDAHAFLLLRGHLNHAAKTRAFFIFEPNAMWKEAWMNDAHALANMQVRQVEDIRKKFADYVRALVVTKGDMIKVRRRYERAAPGAEGHLVYILTHPERYDAERFKAHGGTLVGYLSMATKDVLELINTYFGDSITDLDTLKGWRERIHREVNDKVQRKNMTLKVGMPRSAHDRRQFGVHSVLLPDIPPDIILGILPCVLESRASPLDEGIFSGGFADTLPDGSSRSLAPPVVHQPYIEITAEVDEIAHLINLMGGDRRFPAQEMLKAFENVGSPESNVGRAAEKKAIAAYNAAFLVNHSKRWTQIGKVRYPWPAPGDVIPTLGMSWFAIAGFIDRINEIHKRQKRGGVKPKPKPTLRQPTHKPAARARPATTPPPDAEFAAYRYGRGALRSSASRCMPFELARLHASSLGFTTKNEYNAWHKGNGGGVLHGVGLLPVNPALEYKFEGFSTYRDFLTTPAEEEDATLAFARACCFEAGCKTDAQWNHYVNSTRNRVRPDGPKRILPLSVSGTVRNSAFHLPFSVFLPQFPQWEEFLARVSAGDAAGTITSSTEWQRAFAQSVEVTAHPEIAYRSPFRFGNGWTGLLEGRNIEGHAFHRFPEPLRVTVPVHGAPTFMCYLHENIGTGLYVVVSTTGHQHFHPSFVGDLDAHGGYQFNNGMDELFTRGVDVLDTSPERLVVNMTKRLRKCINARKSARAAVNKDSRRPAFSGLSHVREAAGTTRGEDQLTFDVARRQYQSAQSAGVHAQGGGQSALQMGSDADKAELTLALTELWRGVLGLRLMETDPNFAWNLGTVEPGKVHHDNAILLDMVEHFHTDMWVGADPPSAEALTAKYGHTMAHMLHVQPHDIDVPTFIDYLIGKRPIPPPVAAEIFGSGKAAATKLSRRGSEDDPMVTADDAEADTDTTDAVDRSRYTYSRFNLDGNYGLGPM